MRLFPLPAPVGMLVFLFLSLQQPVRVYVSQELVQLFAAISKPVMAHLRGVVIFYFYCSHLLCLLNCQVFANLLDFRPHGFKAVGTHIVLDCHCQLQRVPQVMDGLRCSGIHGQEIFIVRCLASIG